MEPTRSQRGRDGGDPGATLPRHRAGPKVGKNGAAGEKKETEYFGPKENIPPKMEFQASTDCCLYYDTNRSTDPIPTSAQCMQRKGKSKGIVTFDWFNSYKNPNSHRNSWEDKVIHSWGWDLTILDCKE